MCGSTCNYTSLYLVKDREVYNLRKRILFLLLFTLLCPACQSETNEEGEEWRLIVKSTEGNDYFINTNSISYSNYFSVFAWYKIVPQKGENFYEKLKSLKFFGADMTDVFYYKVYTEIDCRRQLIKMLITQAYTSDNRLIKREETLSAQWAPIPIGSTFDMIREIICKQYY